MEACPPTTHPRFDPATTILDSKTYVFGGSFKQDSSSYLLGWMEVFDPALKEWELLPNPFGIDLASMISFVLLESRKEILVTSWILEGNSFPLYIYNTTNHSWKKITTSVPSQNPDVTPNNPQDVEHGYNRIFFLPKPKLII